MLFADGNFSSDFIKNNRMLFHENRLDKRVLVSFDTKLVIKPKDVTVLLKRFNKLFDNEEFKEHRFHEHKKELILLLLLIHNTYWIIPIGEHKYNKNKKLKKDMVYDDLSNEKKELFRLQELASVVDVLISYHERKSEALSPIKIQISKHNAKLISPVSQKWFVEALEMRLDHSSVKEIGSGIGLAVKYFEAKKNQNYDDLKVILKHIHARDAFKAKNPIINKAIAEMSLLIRHYVQSHKLISEEKLLPSVLLRFMSRSFEVFGIRISEFDVGSKYDIEELKKIISARLNQLKTSSQKRH